MTRVSLGKNIISPPDRKHDVIVSLELMYELYRENKKISESKKSLLSSQKRNQNDTKKTCMKKIGEEVPLVSYFFSLLEQNNFINSKK